MKYTLPHPLTKAIEEDKLVIFLGAGISSMHGMPLWTKIVEQVLEQPEVDKGQQWLYTLQNGLLSPLEVLDRIKEKNRKSVYRIFEKETSKKIDAATYKKLAKISQRFVTTNYDSLIEYNTGISPIDTGSQFNLLKLDDLNSYVLKIHGSCNSIDNAVIFTENYEKLYNTQDGLPRFQFEKIVSTNTCLFLGFSMSDNYVSDLFEKLHAMSSGLGREHYIVSTSKPTHSFLNLINIDSHSDIELFIDQLVSIKETYENTPQNPSEALSTTSSFIEEKNSENVSEVLSNDALAIHIGHDKPPMTENWAGRTEELRHLTISHNVCFITGIGGQGKSALASKLLSESSSEYDVKIWRDFKEEELNLQSKLFGLIETLSNGNIKAQQIVGLETEVLISLFFKELGDRKALIVFDNIDKYINLQTFLPAGDMQVFFDKALKGNHNSKFIFTCRPFVHYAGIGFYQVRLEGLVLSEIKEFIKKYHPRLDDLQIENIARELHSATKGHPLWMGLILAQSRTDVTQIAALLKKINQNQHSASDTDISGIIADRVLENVWNGLKDKEKVILRTLSITNISETEEDLAKIVSPKLNYNQFNKALKSLKSLNLIVIKQGAQYLELHPLVREYIKTNYGMDELESYISLYVSYLDGIIVLIRKKFGRLLGAEDLEAVTKKVEVLIENGKTQEAINDMRLASDSYLMSGYSEEFLRLCDLLLAKDIWTKKTLTKLNGFLELMDIFFTKSADFGAFELFDKYITRYEEVFTNPDSHKILALSSRCHKEWCAKNYARAIIEGKSASDLIDLLQQNEAWAGKHRYYLALRDNGGAKNLVRAISFFTGNRSLVSLANSECNRNLCTSYGNVGKCFLDLGNARLALFFVLNSYIAMNHKDATYQEAHNLGFASKWISEILQFEGHPNAALYFLMHAKNIWKDDMPVEANKLNKVIKAIPTSASKESIVSLESWQIEKHCDEWVKSKYENYSTERNEIMLELNKFIESATVFSGTSL